jgi:hypothetical protein
MQSPGNVSTFDNCNGSHVGVGRGVREGAGVDVGCAAGGGVAVSLAAGDLSVVEGMAGVQAARQHRIDTILINILVNMLSSSLGRSVPVRPLGENANG